MNPLSQIVRWGQVAQPLIHSRALFAQPPWPEAIHQDARPIRSRGRFVDSFHDYLFCRHWVPAWGMALLYYCSGLLKDEWSARVFFLVGSTVLKIRNGLLCVSVSLW